MIKGIKAKVLLSSVKGQPDSWFGLKYTMNLYRGCQHQCIYCDSRSECYGIENFSDILVKENAIDLLRKELASKRQKGTVGTGSMNDPYMPVEAERKLARQALEVIAEFRFPVHIVTKSDLVLRDLDILKEIARVFAAVSITVTTADDALSGKLEPGAPPSSARFRAMKELAANGIHTGVTMMPVLPFIEDTPENVLEIVSLADENGASYVAPWFGMSMRDRQRAYYYKKLDKLFPGLADRYEQQYRERYQCPSPRASELGGVFEAACAERGLATRMHAHVDATGSQLSLF